ncbi:MAG: cyclic nucleotide-binding domain-containing protein [Alphaproteobacteria bacterium]
MTAGAAADLPLYAGLSAAELDEIGAGLVPRTFADGETLMAQGERADGAHFLVSGKVRIATKLPGGGETLIAEPGPGALLGELALIRPEPRGASVRANGPVETLFTDRRYFRAALGQRRTASVKLLRNLIGILTRRLHRTHRRIARHVTDEPKPDHFRPPPRAETGTPVDFDVAAYLGVLPALAGFTDDERAGLFELGEVVQASRGTVLDPLAGGWIVVRGAVLAAVTHDTGLHQVHILGPGRFAALDRRIEPEALALTHVAREQSTLLRLSAEASRRLVDGDDALAQHALDAIAHHQAGLLLGADRHLTRLVGLSRLYAQHAAR